METRRRSPLRILAPIALIAFGVALYMIIQSANKDDSGGGGPSASQIEKNRDLGTADKTTTKKTRSRDKLPQRFYIVKTGDTLGSIAEKTGIPIERLQSLNPNLDQFSLNTGQRIKLR